MIKHCILLLVFALWLVGLPLVGTSLAGKPIIPYLNIPPDTIWGKYPVNHPPFSWGWFTFYAAIILLATGPLVRRFLSWRGEHTGKARRFSGRFPWWGWLGTLLLLFGWYAEWSRANWIRVDHPPAFGPLWIGFILLVNALCYLRTGSCLMLDRPKRFLLLFPLSAGFWWFFEYLNRYVQNWQYIHVEISPTKYFILATIAFSTVLPGVLSVCYLLRTCPRFEESFRNFRPIRPKHPRLWALTALVITGGGYGLIGVFPNHSAPSSGYHP